MRLITVLAFLLTFLFPSNGLGQVQKLRGKVIGVADGDTIVVLDEAKRENRVRLQGIDAPEYRQAYGTASRKNLSALIFKKSVEIEYDKPDKLGRIVAIPISPWDFRHPRE